MGSRRRWLLAAALAVLCTISWLHMVKSRAHAELISARSQLKFRRLQLTDQAAPSDGIISAAEAASAGMKPDQLSRTGRSIDGTLGWTALHYAAKNRNLEVAEFLVGVGADKNARSKVAEVPNAAL